MNLDEIRSEFAVLHGEASGLMRDVLHTRVSIGFVFKRRPLGEFENRLDDQLKRFASLDGEFISHASPPGNINAALRASAHFTLHSAVRDSVRGLLTATSDAIGALRNQLDFKASLLVSVLAFVVGIISLVVATLSFLARSSG